MLFLRRPCPPISQGKNGHFVLDSNLGYVKIIQEQWQCTQCSKPLQLNVWLTETDIFPENITFQCLRRNTDITFFFGRINCDAMESVLMSTEHFVQSSIIHCSHWLKFSAAHWGMNLDVQLLPMKTGQLMKWVKL